MRELRDLSGFGWDEGRQMLTALGEVWAKYVEASDHSFSVFGYH